jgi:hypothetical protein
VGQLFLKSDPVSGSTLYACNSVDNWSAATVYSAGTGITITGSSIATEDAMVPVYYAGSGAPVLDCAAGRDYYVDTTAGALYYCKNNGNWQPVSSAGHTHTASDITSGVLAASLLPAGIPFTSQANTFAAGQRQCMGHDANNAGLRLTPAPGDPANPLDGDVWYNASTGTFRRRQNGVVSDWASGSGGTAHHLLSLTHDDTAPASPVRGDLITAQGTAAVWSRLGLGGAGYYLRSNGADLVYATIAAGDLPVGYPWTSLANVPTSFAPAGHASSHLSGGSDAIAAASTSIRGTVTTTTGNSQAVSTDDSRMTNARTPTSHANTHQNGGSDEIATATPASNAIPKAGAGGALAPGWLPTPTASTLGGVQSKDCTGVGHVLKINTDGSATCSADSGGGSVTMAGEYRPFGDFTSQSGGASMTANQVYYFRFTPQINMPWSSFIAVMGATSSSTHVAIALMDSNCAKIAGSDVNVTALQTGGANGWVYAHPATAPLTLTAGAEYYWAVVGEAAYTWISNGVTYNPYYFAGTPDVPYFTGSSAATGSGATLAVPSTCGTRSRVSDVYRPIIILSTH